MVAQRELDERLRAIEAKLLVEERDWRDEERKLFELEETYLRETTVHGNIFTGWGDAKTAPIRFRNAARRRKKRERQDPLAQPALSVEEQLKVDKHRVASYSALTSPAESIRATIADREAKAAEKAAAAAAAASTGGGVTASPTKPASNKSRAAPPTPTAGKPSPAKKARK
jgi:hypothetical protein